MKQFDKPLPRRFTCRTSVCLLFFAAFCFFSASAARADTEDPFETVNRGIFWVNDKLDIYIVEPIARAYDEYVPNAFQNHINAFFVNIRTPIYVVSDLVQLKFDQAGNHAGRFLINTTLGGLGLVDVAKSFGMKHKSADFGVALGVRGVGEGPYIVIPILGPSNARDLFGRIVDIFLNPVHYASSVSDSGSEISWGATVVEGIDDRANLLEGVEAAKEASVDYYSFVKNSYHQYRQNVIYDNNPPDEETDVDKVE